MDRLPAIAVSACLAGECCTYKASNNLIERYDELAALCLPVLVCPEVLGGLPTPRDPSEIQGNKVVSCRGTDVTCEYERGAAEALRLAQEAGCAFALLKENSPSCGCGHVYDGTFSHTLVEGDGITARAFKREGIATFGESQIDALIEAIHAERL